jgi:Fe-Mn family superoxide dismutase
MIIQSIYQTTQEQREEKMPFTLPTLPYEQNALEPHISSETLSFHHGKHHNTYVVKLNEAIQGTNFEGQELEEIIKNSEGKNQGIFNNSAQVWNHTFYWNSMTPNGGGNPTGELAEKINEDFGSYENFRKEFTSAGATQFGSGWAWLVLNSNNKLEVTKTLNAETPLTSDATPLLTMDVWEHAYYLDYQNARPKYMDVFLDSLVNWDFANENYLRAKQQSSAAA